MSGIYLGVDPGTKGAVCVLDPFDPDATVFIPLDQSPRQLHSQVVAATKGRLVTPVMIEDVHSLFGMSAKSNFSFGWNVGMIHGVIASAGCSIDLVQPKQWQKVVGVKTVPTGTVTKQRTKVQKQNVADKCAQLYPNVVIHGPKGGLQDGKSDSLLIAHYCYLKYGSAGLV
jgi:hypothetical protein